jgi:hypothetical protein
VIRIGLSLVGGLVIASKWIGGRGVVAWRPVILGAIGGLCGAASFVQELGIIRPLR